MSQRRYLPSESAFFFFLPLCSMLKIIYAYLDAGLEFCTCVVSTFSYLRYFVHISMNSKYANKHIVCLDSP